MVQKKIQWGCVHGGEYMRIVRIELKNDRPFIIISSNIPVDAEAPNSMYSLICYMLLTSKENQLRIFEETRQGIPDPPPVLETGPGLRLPSGKICAAVPGNVQVVSSSNVSEMHWVIN